MRADRLLSLVLLLQTRGHATAGQLAAEVAVSVRTIYRDMVALNTAGIPVCADATGYRLVDGYRTHLTGFTAEEARALALAGVPAAAAELGLAKAVAAAQLKIATALPAALRDRAEQTRERFLVDSPGWYRDGDASEHLVAVADAVWRQRAVEVEYETWTRVVRRRLEPYGLVLKAGRWYLVAGVDGAPRTYRVNQISALTVLPDGFDRPEGFDLEAHWHGHVAEFRDRLYTGEALVRLSPATVPRLPHLMGSAVGRAAAAGVTQPDGWMLARVPIESHAHAAGEFLRLGAGVEVLEPAALRDLLARTVADLTALYGRPPPAGTTGAAGQESPPPPAGAAG